MADVTLGQPIKQLTVILSAGGVDFSDKYTHDTSFDPAAIVKLAFSTDNEPDVIVWPASALSGSNAFFTATGEQIQSVIDSGATKVRLTSKVGDVTLLLAAGSLSIQGR